MITIKETQLTCTADDEFLRSAETTRTWSVYCDGEIIDTCETEKEALELAAEFDNLTPEEMEMVDYDKYEEDVS